MTNLALLLICLFVGILLQKSKSLGSHPHVILNTVILHLPLPAIALLTIPTLSLDLSLMVLVLVPWISFLVAYLFFRLFKGKWDKQTLGCLILTAGLANTSFVGFSVVEAMFGKDALKYAVVLDQAGSFLIVSSLGVWLASVYSSSDGLRLLELAKKIITFPPFVAFIVAVVLGFLGWQAQGIYKEVLERIALILTPLAMVSVGLQLKISHLRHDYSMVAWGLLYKLVIIPAIIFGLYTLIDVPQKILQVCVIEAAMAPMITASILAAGHNLRPRLAGLMVGVGVPFSFLTLGLWYLILQH